MMMKLDQALRELTGYRLRRATSAAMPMVNQMLVPFGLRRTTFSALTVITENPGLSQSQLAKALAIERPNIVQIVDELERLKLVARHTTPKDKRAYALQATDKGKDVQLRSSEALEQFEARLTEGMSPSEIETLHRLLQTVENNATHTELSDELEVSCS